MSFYIGQEVKSSEIKNYNYQQINAARGRCLNAFLSDMNGKIKEGESFVYTQDPTTDCQGVYRLIKDYKTSSFSDVAEQVEASEVKETEYYSNGYSGTIYSDGRVDIHENTSSETVRRTRVDRIYNAKVESNFYYVLCEKANMQSVINYINDLTNHYHGYREMQSNKISTLRTGRFLASFGWLLAFLDSLLCIYLFFPFAGQMAASDTHTPDHIFTVFEGQAYLFWPLFAISMTLKVIAFILALVVNYNTATVESDQVGYLCFNYILFPIVVATIFIMTAVWNNNPSTYDVLSIIAFILFIIYGLSAIGGVVGVFFAHGVVSENRRNHSAATAFSKKYKDPHSYEIDVAKLKSLVIPND